MKEDKLNVLKKSIKKSTLFMIVAYVFCCVIIGLLFIFIFITDVTDIEHFGWKEKYVEDFGYFKLPFGVEFHQDEATGLVYFTDLYQKIILVEIDDSKCKGNEIAKHTYSYHNDEVRVTEIKDFEFISSKTTYTHKTVNAKINDTWKDVVLFTWNVDEEFRYFLFTNDKYSTRYGDQLSKTYMSEDEYLYYLNE